MLFGKNLMPDGRPTMSEWPVRVWAEKELKEEFRIQARKWIKGEFEEYRFVYAPERKTAKNSYAYVFGYGKEEVLFLKKSEDGVERILLRKDQVREAAVERELLNVQLKLYYEEKKERKELVFPYVASVYYLYDPFLNWVLNLEQDFQPTQAEGENPRPEKLYHESLPMYNFSLDAYRLGNGFQEYQYHKEECRSRWMPWKKHVKEWLKIDMEKGIFEVYSEGYYKRCRYCMISEDQ